MTNWIKILWSHILLWSYQLTRTPYEKDVTWRTAKFTYFYNVKCEDVWVLKKSISVKKKLHNFLIQIIIYKYFHKFQFTIIH